MAAVPLHELVGRGAVIAGVVPSGARRVLREAARTAEIAAVPLVVVYVDKSRTIDGGDVTALSAELRGARRWSSITCARRHAPF